MTNRSRGTTESTCTTRLAIVSSSWSRGHSRPIVMWRCSVLSTLFPEYSLDQLRLIAAAAGAEGLELRLGTGHGHALDVADRATWHPATGSGGCAVVCLATSARIGATPVAEVA